MDSSVELNSLGILSMENLKVFGELSSFCESEKSTPKSETSNINERLKQERLLALKTLERGTQNKKTHEKYPNSILSNLSGAPTLNGTNLSELITDETINLNSSCSVAIPNGKRTNVSFEPNEITGRSTLCQNYDTSAGRSHSSNISSKSKNISVADILKASFVEKARLLEKKLQRPSQQKDVNSSVGSITSDSFNFSQSLPRTADMSTTQNSNISLNGGAGFSFRSSDINGQPQLEESFVGAEFMQSKLVLGEISWAEKFAAVPVATLSKEALQKIAAPPKSSDIETSISNSIIAGDPDFSVGNFFKTRSENISNIVCIENPKDLHQEPQKMRNLSNASILNPFDTPKTDNNTYTKSHDNGKVNIMKNKHKENYKKAMQEQKAINTQRSPLSECPSLAAINRALQELNLSTDTSTVDVVNKLWGKAPKYDYGDNDVHEEDKENSQPTLVDSKHIDTMSFTDSVLDSTDFVQLQQSISMPRKTPDLKPESAAAPEILVTDFSNYDGDADIDEWPSTPVKPPHRRVRRTKSPTENQSPTFGLQILPGTDDEDKTPVNKNRSNTTNCSSNDKTPINKYPSQLARVSQNPASSMRANSTRLDGCDAIVSSSEYDFGISPNLGGGRSSVSNNLLPSRNISPLSSSPRSCLSSPLLDSTTSSDRRRTHGGGQSTSSSGIIRKIHSSPVGSEANNSTTSAFTASQRGASAIPRSISRCSNSSEFSHRDGKYLPLKVTHTSLCWGSSKLRTDSRKSMQVKNISEKRLIVRLGIHGPGFQLVSNGSNTITLQSMECRTITITFCPTVCGAAIGALSFYAPIGSNTTSNQSSMEIPLYGYGGNAALTVQGLLKGPVGASFLTIGDVCDLSSGPLSTSFKFYNKGPLVAYACISMDSTVLMKPRLIETFEVRPNKLIIPAYSEATVQVIFRPNREDVKNILKKSSMQVLTLGNMRIFCGDEPNRQRMRALVQRMTAKQREQLTSSMLDNIWCNFPNEQPEPNIATLNEPPEFILDLVTMVRIIDVALTLNRDIDESMETSMMILPEAEESILFRTICVTNSNSPTPTLEPVDELLEADTTTTAINNSLNPHQSLEPNWTVTPKSIEFDFRNATTNNRAELRITNCFKSRQYFEITCNMDNLLEISPRECFISPDGGQVKIIIQPWQAPRREKIRDVFITVSMENDQIHVPINFHI